MSQTIKCDIQDHIMTITLHRPERMNAFNTVMLEELVAAFDRADEDDYIRAIIITGEGRAFCAGADLDNGSQSFTGDVQDTEEFRDTGGILSLRIYDLKKPIIAAINGAAVGVGITMTLPMDIRIAATTAKMGFVFCRRGIAPEACSGWFLPRIVGISKASEWVLTGRVFSAQEALDNKLVSQVVSPEELLPTAQAIAKEIAENTSATSVALSRQLLWRMLGANHPARSHEIESKMIQWSSAQADAKEGVASFFEKRQPEFKLKVSKDMPSFYPWW
ncbi:crotonase/enoyl-CoA hydratase family protein [Alkalihalobacillus sp. BA299]|uniref:crotonase/enoyl-CoA hydratase family protein n=1 Tax=Alkalihalobacillus sp. BA299 TaxID=2815938 RepID=UPI001ADB4936|nr:crotonase/enoyl-CoA hydratase family protein [Alkalihalobacillus sp. BA299]